MKRGLFYVAWHSFKNWIHFEKLKEKIRKCLILKTFGRDDLLIPSLYAVSIFRPLIFQVDLISLLLIFCHDLKTFWCVIQYKSSYLSTLKLSKSWRFLLNNWFFTILNIFRSKGWYSPVPLAGTYMRSIFFSSATALIGGGTCVE